MLSEAEIYDNRTKKYHRIRIKLYRKVMEKYDKTKDPNDFASYYIFVENYNKKYPIRIEGTFLEELQRL